MALAVAVAVAVAVLDAVDGAGRWPSPDAGLGRDAGSIAFLVCSPSGLRGASVACCKVCQLGDAVVIMALSGLNIWNYSRWLPELVGERHVVIPTSSIPRILV